MDKQYGLGWHFIIFSDIEIFWATETKLITEKQKFPL